MRKPIREIKRDILHRFYDMSIYFNNELLDKNSDMYKDIEYDYLFDIRKYDYSLVDIEHEENLRIYQSSYLDLDLVPLNEAFEKVKNLKNKYGNDYEKIVLNNTGNGYESVCHRIEGLYTESEEDFQKRIEEYDQEMKARSEARSKQKIENQKKQDLKKSVLEKLSQEERLILGYK